MLGLEIAAFAFATCATPGPVNIVASISGAQNGVKANLPFVLGATSGLSLVIIITGLGIGQLLKTNTLLANTMILLGSAYMLYLAYMTANASVLVDNSNKKTSIPGFYQGSIVQILNPKAWLVSMAGAALYLNEEAYFLTLLIYVALFFIICFIAVITWVYIGHLAAATLNEKHLSIFNRVMASLLTLLVLYNLYDTFF